jgi:hypothetical protein
MAGKKTFVAGEVLLAQDVNDFLMDQSVMVFASDAARSSAIPTPTEGMFAVTTNNDQLDYYDGSAWITAIRITSWTNYTPTFTNFTLGNGTINFTYAQIGKTVHVRGSITLGSTSSLTGSIIFSLPFEQATTLNAPIIGNCRLGDANGNTFAGLVLSQGASTANCVTTNVASTYPTITSTSATVPFTWTTSDNVNVNLTYQAVT